MATWRDGPEYAPLAPPTGYEPPAAGPLATVETSPSEATTSEATNSQPASAQQASADAPVPPATTPPAFAAPADTVPLDRLEPTRTAARDPRQPFPAVARTPRAGSPWRSAHSDPPPEAESTPAPVPIPSFRPFRAASGTGYPDLDAQVRTARWLLVPAVLFVIGALAGPWVTAAVLVSAALLGSLPGIRPGARSLSRIVAGLLGALWLLLAMVGRDWTYLAGMSRFVGLVYSLAMASWYIRQRADLEAERRRRTAVRATWPDGQGQPR